LRVVTDGINVFWADNGLNAVTQIPAAGGSATVLGTVTSGTVTSELWLNNNKIAYSNGTGVFLATLGLPNSGLDTWPEQNVAVSMDSTDNHFFFSDFGGVGSAGASIVDCVFTNQGGPCGAVAQLTPSSSLLLQTVADGTYMFYEFTQAGLYRETIGTRSVSLAIAGAQASSLALDGTYVYWAQGTIASSAVYRTSEANPGTVTAIVPNGVYDYTFATDGSRVYYSDGTHILSIPAAGGGTASQLALAHGAAGIGQLAIGGKLLVWTDGATIWGMVLP
jgi:hypothetical protein